MARTATERSRCWSQMRSDDDRIRSGANRQLPLAPIALVSGQHVR